MKKTYFYPAVQTTKLSASAALLTTSSVTTPDVGMPISNSSTDDQW